MSISPVIYLFVSILLGFTARADESLSFSQNARTFETQPSTLLTKSLAYSCLSLYEVGDGLPCNPAATPLGKKKTLRAQGLTSNGYSNISRTRRLLSETTDQSVVNDLFANEHVLQTEAQVQLSFLSNMMNARYTPFGFKYFSVARNDANPDIELFAVEEQELTFQSGFQWQQFSFGLELRRIDWRFIRQRFKLLDLITPAGQEAIKPRKQTAYFIQPAVLWQWGLAWDPRVSMMVVNLGSVNTTYDEFKHPTEAQFGFGISPPISVGKLDVLLDYKSLGYDESTADKLHWGGLYRYGAMNLALGLDSYGASTGVYYGLDQINAGVMYSTTNVPWKSKDYYAQTVYVQLGWQI